MLKTSWVLSLTQYTRCDSSRFPEEKTGVYFSFSKCQLMKKSVYSQETNYKSSLMKSRMSPKLGMRPSRSHYHFLRSTKSPAGLLDLGTKKPGTTKTSEISRPFHGSVLTTSVALPTPS